MEIVKLAKIMNVLEWIVFSSVVTYGLYVLYGISKDR